MFLCFLKFPLHRRVLHQVLPSLYLNTEKASSQAHFLVGIYTYTSFYTVLEP